MTGTSTTAPALLAMRGIVKRFGAVTACDGVDLTLRAGDVLGLLGELQARGVDLFLHQQALDTATPAGRMLFGMLGLFGEFERSMVRELDGAGKGDGRAAPRPVRRGHRAGRAPPQGPRRRPGHRLEQPEGEVS